MLMKRHSYLSCYGPQFIHGLVIVADKSKYRPKVFLKKAFAFPNHFDLIKVAPPRNFRAGDVRSVLWSAIASTWLVMGAILFVLQPPLNLWLAFALVLTLLAPILLILLASAVLMMHKIFPR